MKTITFIFITSITIMSVGSAFAENSVPPSGPYKSSSDDSNNNYARNRMFNAQPQTRDFNNQMPNEIPEWVMQQQMQIEQMRRQHNMPPPSYRNQQNWNNQMPPMMNPNANRFAPNNNINYPPMRGPVTQDPVYRPDVVPPGFNNQPGSRWAVPPSWR